MMMHDKYLTMQMSFDIKFIRLDQRHIMQALPFLHCFWSRLINLISKDTNMVFSVSHGKQDHWVYVCSKGINKTAQ